MKPLRQKVTFILALFVLGVTVAIMGKSYLNYISKRTYEDSVNHVEEVYNQVNHNFVSFLERNWKNLDDWNHHVALENEEGVIKYLDSRKECWKFTEFYFLAKDGSYITPTGDKGVLTLEGVRDTLFEEGIQVMSNETLSTKQAVTVFAIPVPKGIWRDFEYSSIAISYTNADMVKALNLEAFSGQSSCFVIDSEGGVFLSSKQGGSVFGNYLSYLRAASDLDDAALEQLQKDWKAGKSDVISCKVGGVKEYISYQSVGYQDCLLLGVVPEAASSASLNRITKATIDVLIKMFLIIGILTYCIHRQQMKKNVIELQYRDIMFDALSLTVNDIFMMLDAKTFNVDFLSSNVERLLGIPQEAVRADAGMLGESIADKKNNKLLEWKKELTAIPLYGSGQWEQEHLNRKSGEKRWFLENVYHVSVREMEKYIVVMSDRTQEKQLNQHLQEALDTAKSANEAKSHFLSNMSHDIRTPMNAIVGFAVLLAKDAENPDKVREYTRKISASSQHLLSLINDVLDMSKIESGKTSLHINQFSLPELLEELYIILLPQAKAKRQTFELRLQGQPPEQLLGDRMRINQILINLLSNAIKYTPVDGHIDFLVEELPQSSPQFAHLRFSVKDDGIGMSEEFLNMIFEPFVREANSTISGIQGTGLGMAITKNLVELMGGTIGVESRQGEGSTFTVELSFALPVFEDDSGFWTQRGITRVLVADDEEDICTSIQSVMKDTGVAVSYVMDGASAVDAAIDAKERNHAFHVILLDWKMPRMDGVTAAKKIREKLNEDVPILVLTSYDWSDIEEEARSAGIDAFIPKPFFVSTFRQAVESLEPVHKLAEQTIEEDVLKGMMFLVAEDNELNAEILTEMLDMEGAKCEIAANGQEALRMFEKSGSKDYDMILMDVQMPVMGGYEATRAIRSCGHARAETIPIIAMTANAFAEDVQDALEAGMNDHLAKPIDMNAVKAAISRLRKAEENEVGESDI